jgi:tRNA(adenine34) deaminase
MDKHQKNMIQLISFTQKDNDCIPYGSSIYDENNNCLVSVVANPTISPINHAEIMAIQKCAYENPGIQWDKLTLYTTGEPCCMCAAACCWSNLKEVIYATDVPFMIDLWGIESHIRARDIIQSYPRRPHLIEKLCHEESDKIFLKFKDTFKNMWNEKRWEMA